MWGDVPGWRSAPASVLALLFAGVAVVVANRTFRIVIEPVALAAEQREQFLPCPSAASC
ncbi:hypothetical protein ACPPVO_32005 [Dactylosporangium sp. McL0621]|uniref:hypothetical protein n=1 Tax=Dactylosporangium sp. McL0621 TaxID=3415678 RepID=UPI003CEDA59D